MPNLTLAPISDELHRAIDSERSTAYSKGADAVWQMLGVTPNGPNEAVFNSVTHLYEIQPKS